MKEMDEVDIFIISGFTDNTSKKSRIKKRAG